jgi:hypothetical protein
MARQIGTLGTIDTITVGGRVFTDLTNMIILHGRHVGTNGCTLRKDSGSAGYQVTTGKTMTVYATRSWCINAANDTPTLAQSDNDVGVNSATALTNAVQQAGSSSITYAPEYSVNTLGTQPSESVLAFPIAALKYLTSKGATASADIRVTAFCYEA